RPDHQREHDHEYRRQRAEQSRAQLDEMRDEAFLIDAHEVPVLPASVFAASAGLSRLAAAAFSSLSTFATSLPALETSSFTELWKFDAACCIESRILRSSSSSTSRLMSAFTSAT